MKSLLIRIARKLISEVDLPLARARLQGDATLSADERKMLGKLVLELHPADAMYVPFKGEHYLRAGLSALGNIERALEARAALTHEQRVRFILDFPCGHGRVMRFMRERFPAAKLCAAELDHSAQVFCARVFGATPLASRPDFEAIKLHQRFDLIWCGSLVTHLDEPSTRALLGFFHQHLAPNGLCVFTTHGRHSVELLQSRAATYGLTDEAQGRVLAGYRATGYGFAEYPGAAGYGISLTARETLARLAADTGPWTEVLFAERGWDAHQDVFAFVKRA